MELFEFVVRYWQHVVAAGIVSVVAAVLSGWFTERVIRRFGNDKVPQLMMVGSGLVAMAWIFLDSVFAANGAHLLIWCAPGMAIAAGAMAVSLVLL